MITFLCKCGSRYMGNLLGLCARDYITIYIIPMSYDTRYDESISDNVTNKYTGAYDSNVIIVRIVLSSLKLPNEYFHISQIFCIKKEGVNPLIITYFYIIQQDDLLIPPDILSYRLLGHHHTQLDNHSNH